MTRWCATTAPGLEPTVRDELGDLGAKPVDLAYGGRGLVGFELPADVEGQELLHTLRTVHRVGPLLREASVDPEEPWEELRALVDQAPLTRWIDARTRWAFRVARTGEHPYGSPDVERRIGGAIDEALTGALEQRPPVDLEDPDTLLRMHLDGDGHLALWVDLVGQRSLHRRGVRVHEHPAAMKATIAAGLVRETGWDPASRLVDPMAGGGTLAIEAAWAALGVSPVHLRADDLLVHRVPPGRGHAIDPGPGVPREADPPVEPWILACDHAPNHVEGLRRNLEAAGVGSLVEARWKRARDLTDEVDEAGALVANPPYGIRSGEGDLREPYARLLGTAAELLASGGRVGLLTPRDDIVHPLAEEHGFTVCTDRPLHHGRLRIRLIVLEA